MGLAAGGALSELDELELEELVLDPESSVSFWIGSGNSKGGSSNSSGKKIKCCCFG